MRHYFTPAFSKTGQDVLWRTVGDYKEGGGGFFKIMAHISNRNQQDMPPMLCLALVWGHLGDKQAPMHPVQERQHDTPLKLDTPAPSEPLRAEQLIPGPPSWTGGGGVGNTS